MPIRSSGRRPRARLYISLLVLGIVLMLAIYAQFYKTGARNRIASGASQPPPIQTRAVFGEVVEPPKTDSPSTPDAPDPRSETTATEQINGLLNRWRNAQIVGNVDGQTSMYAPEVTRYFNQRGVSRERLHREKLRMKELYPKVLRYDISDVKIESLSSDRATVTFRKDWGFRGERSYMGAGRQRLRLQRMLGDWKIVSEEELRTYWSQRT